MQLTDNLLWVVPLAPVSGALVLGLLALSGAHSEQVSRRRRTLIGLIGCAGPLIAVIASAVIFAGTAERVYHATLFQWFAAGGITVDFSLEADRLTAIMLPFVTFIGFLIHVYSIGYMHHEKGVARFFAYLNLFLGFMLILVMGSNLVMMFLGWEGVGLCSYLLIAYWFDDDAKATAGKKAFITNRIGDCGFILGIFLIFFTLRQQGVVSLEFSALEHHAGHLAPIAFVAGLLLFLGAVGKSAQIPLHVWLPDAMAGPTPVSALIHAATMVTAGVYMVARMHFLYDLAPDAGRIIAATGMATAIMAALIGTSQYDIKKILAYSTISQLGFMFVGVGVGAYDAGLFHVFTHAFFKAGLFLCAGSIIHGLHGEQDIRAMGGMLRKMPVTSVTMLACWLAICGIPPFAGFFSKDEILHRAFAQGDTFGRMLWAAGIAGAGLTAFYMSRLVFTVLFGSSRFTGEKEIVESPAVMTIPLVVLAIGACVAGFAGFPGHSAFGSWLAPVFGSAHGGGEATLHHGTQVNAPVLMAVSVAVAVAGISIAAVCHRRKLFIGGKQSPIGALFGNAFFIDAIYRVLIVSPLRLLAVRVLHAILDVRIVDGLVNLCARVSRFAGSGLRRAEAVSVTGMIISSVIGVTLLLFIFTFVK